ncbi:MAG TPA: CHAD domain-containing protein [Vicinamibacteria bacterium]
MAFRLKDRTRIAAGLQRLVRKEYGAALDELSGADSKPDTVHEARKSLKKIRAVLRLLEPDLGSDFRAEDDRLRDASHHLASLRDADATAETLGTLHSRYPTVVTPQVTRSVLRGVRGAKRQARRGANGLIGRAATAVRRSQRTTPGRIRRAGRLAAVEAGLTRGYRRARKTMKRLGVDSDATQFHAWRRRVKSHTYHVRLFEGLHGTPRGRVRSLRRLETWLGEDHNQAILRAAILASPDRFGDARTTAVVLGCIIKRQAWLRERALKLGHRVFTAKPERFRQSARAWWRPRAGQRR